MKRMWRPCEFERLHVCQRVTRCQVSCRYLTAASNAPATNKASTKADTGPTITLADAKLQIDASFREAKETPVHPTREGIHAVQVMPLLPYFERYGHTHVTASSTSEVVTHVLAEGTSEEDREGLYGECMMRTYPMRMLLCILLVLLKQLIITHTHISTA